MIPATLHLRGTLAVQAGDAYTLDVQVSGELFTGEDLDTWTFEASIRRQRGPYDLLGTLLDPEATFDIDVTADVEGQATLTLTLDPDVTAGLDHRTRHVWDLQAVDPDDRPHTLLTGTVAVRGEVTATEAGT